MYIQHAHVITVLSISLNSLCVTRSCTIYYVQLVKPVSTPPMTQPVTTHPVVQPVTSHQVAQPVTTFPSIHTCPLVIVRGHLAGNCTGSIGESCAYTCDNGTVATSTFSKITCQRDFTWNVPPTAVCERECKRFRIGCVSSLYSYRY
jgi:hypothetical protein